MPQVEVSDLAAALRDSVNRCTGSRSEIGLLFSGGLDSAILAVLARKRAKVIAYVIGLAGSTDIPWARQCAAILDLELVEVELKEADVADSIGRIVTVHRVAEPKWMSTFVAQELAFGRVREQTVMSGQGADELFGGYAKYLRVENPATAMAHDLGELMDNELPALKTMAGGMGRNLILPYLEPEVVDISRRLPLQSKLADGCNKLVLREAARLIGVPEMMASRPKKAMQYGAGISKAIRKHLASQEKDMRGLIASLRD